MANLQIKQVPEDIHSKLRYYAKEDESTLSAWVLAILRQEVERLEWEEHLAQRPLSYPSVSTVSLLEEAREERDRERDTTLYH
ncbi:MAG: hypothetical protein R2880_05855 [Deinococcales bacterium]